MQSVIDFVVANFQKYIGSISLFVALQVILYFIFQQVVQSKFNTKIEHVKGDLNRKLESLKLEHQKLLFNFQAYNSKKHEKYPELHRLIEQAIGLLLSLSGVKIDKPDFQKYDIESIKIYCEKTEMLESEKNEVLNLWKNDKNQAISMLEKIVKRIQYQQTYLKVCDANNYFVENELYFSDEVANKTSEFISLMFTYWNILNPNYVGYAENYKDSTLLKMQIEEKRRELKSILKKEISPELNTLTS